MQMKEERPKVKLRFNFMVNKGVTFNVIFVPFLILLLGVNLANGTSESMYETLRGFVENVGLTVKEVMKGLEKVHKGFKTMEEILDNTVDEDCVFECPNGQAFEPSSTHKPNSNGCGSFGLEEYLTGDMVPYISEFVDCCNNHDICYGTCGTDKDECDLKFKKCLYAKCSKNKGSVSKLNHKGCQASAKFLFLGTTAIGCQPFIIAQREACVCPSQENDNKHEHSEL